jgi:hypothetical protein
VQKHEFLQVAVPTMNRRERLAIFLIVGLQALVALAKEAPSHVPPSLYERFTRSALFVGTMGVLLAAAVAISMRIAVGRASQRSRYLTFGLVVLMCVMVGSAWAATDSQNYEARNPALYGSFALSPILPAAILLLQPRRAVGIWIPAILSIAPFCLVSMFLLVFVQAAGFNLSW